MLTQSHRARTSMTLVTFPTTHDVMTHDVIVLQRLLCSPPARVRERTPCVHYTFFDEPICFERVAFIDDNDAASRHSYVLYL